jgi:hypothetical protein
MHNSSDDINAPSSPKPTPTSPIPPDLVPETPRQNRGTSFGDDPSGWTPRFAEDFSVFNSTPGNLRGSQGSFADFVPLTPYPSSAGSKRPLSAGGIAAEIATHANHFSPTPGIPLPPVDPSKCLQSSPDTVSTPFGQRQAAVPESPLQERSTKKARRDILSQDTHSQGQTKTPPPTGRTGRRQLAPKLTPIMQNDQSFPQPNFTATPQQPNMADIFSTTPTDMFGYPMTAPASAPAYTDGRPFWDDTSIMGMDIDFSVANPELFQTPTPAARALGSMEWGTVDQMFQDVAVAAPTPAAQVQTPAGTKRERPLAPKLAMPPPATTAADVAFGPTLAVSVDDPFGMAGSIDAVGPGMLFSQPQAALMSASSFSMAEQQPSSSAPAAPLTTQNASQRSIPSTAPVRGDVRRSASVKELAPKPVARDDTTPATKAAGRPGISRSFSETRGKRPPGRPALSSIVPAPKMGLPPRRDSLGHRSAQHSSRPSGRVSPVKAHHHRLSSLTSIPEASNVPRTRTSVKFTIDEHGRARAETTVLHEEVPKPPEVRHHAARLSGSDSTQQRWESSDDDMSSVDDEPILIPSRNTSFALPDPIKPTRSHPFDRDDDESEAETVVNDKPKVGNAATALRKVIETRQNRPTATSRPGSSSRRLSIPGSRGFDPAVPSQQSSQTISPTTLTDSSGLATPLTDSRGQSVRCVCGRSEVDGDEFCVHW